MTEKTPSHSRHDPDHLGTEPRSVRLTRTLVWPLLVLHAISAALSIIAMRSLGATAYFRQYLPTAEFQQLTPDRLDTTFTAATVSFIGFAVINAALFVIVGLGLRNYRNWARFLGLVLATLFLISAVSTLVFATSYGDLSGLELFETMLSWVIVGVTVWWAIQAFHKNTAQWFAIHRQLQR